MTPHIGVKTVWCWSKVDFWFEHDAYLSRMSSDSQVFDTSQDEVWTATTINTFVFYIFRLIDDSFYSAGLIGFFTETNWTLRIHIRLFFKPLKWFNLSFCFRIIAYLKQIGLGIINLRSTLIYNTLLIWLVKKWELLSYIDHKNSWKYYIDRDRA